MTKPKSLSRGAIAIVLASAVLPINDAQASGDSGPTVPTSIHVEGGNVYVIGSFANPDGCASSTGVVIGAVNVDELQRMTSMAVTAATAGKKVRFWLNGCSVSPWSSSIPKAVAMDLIGG